MLEMREGGLDVCCGLLVTRRALPDFRLGVLEIRSQVFILERERGSAEVVAGGIGPVFVDVGDKPAVTDEASVGVLLTHKDAMRGNHYRSMFKATVPSRMGMAVFLSV